MTTQMMTSSPLFAERRGNGLEYRLIFALSLPVCLAIAALSRLDPRGWSGDGIAARLSVFADARATCGTIAQIAFAG